MVDEKLLFSRCGWVVVEFLDCDEGNRVFSAVGAVHSVKLAKFTLA